MKAVSEIPGLPLIVTLFSFLQLPKEYCLIEKTLLGMITLVRFIQL